MEINPGQILSIALASVPTMLTVLMGILINNSRLGDVNSRINDLRSHMDSRFDEMRSTWTSELRRVEEVTPSRVKTYLVEQAENARLSRRLATIETRAPVEFHPEQYQLKPADQERFADLLRELEFTTLLKNLQASAKPPEDM